MFICLFATAQKTEKLLTGKTL